MKQRDQGWRGVYLRGVMDAHGVQSKQVALLANVHPSTLSRFLTGERSVNETQEIQITLAIGKASGLSNAGR